MQRVGRKPDPLFFRKRRAHAQLTQRSAWSGFLAIPRANKLQHRDVTPVEQGRREDKILQIEAREKRGVGY
jgi:hypothetical protein